MVKTIGFLHIIIFLRLIILSNQKIKRILLDISSYSHLPAS